MNETAHGKELPKPLQPRRRFHRFSAVELLVALALLFLFFPFVEEVKGGDVIISILLSLFLLWRIAKSSSSSRLCLLFQRLPAGGSIISGRPWSHRPCSLSQDSP